MKLESQSRGSFSRFLKVSRDGAEGTSTIRCVSAGDKDNKHYLSYMDVNEDLNFKAKART